MITPPRILFTIVMAAATGLVCAPPARAAEQQPASPSASPSSSSAADYQWVQGGIIRGPRDAKRLALVFTGHEYAEGGKVILDELAERKWKASFFLTGTFLRTTAFGPLVHRMVREGHAVGPHSDAHLLYCPWEARDTTLVTREEFGADLERNLQALEGFGVDRRRVRYWIPPYEWYNTTIAGWSEALGLTLASFTPGTRSNADYTVDGASNFVSSQAILDSIRAREREDPAGLNGFILLLHIGAGPLRTDKMHARFGELLDTLQDRGYTSVRLDDLLRTPPARP